MDNAVRRHAARLTQAASAGSLAGLPVLAQLSKVQAISDRLKGPSDECNTVNCDSAHDLLGQATRVQVAAAPSTGS
jgi:hypothetical protein